MVDFFNNTFSQIVGVVLFLMMLPALWRVWIGPTLLDRLRRLGFFTKCLRQPAKLNPGRNLNNHGERDRHHQYGPDLRRDAFLPRSRRGNSTFP